MSNPTNRPNFPPDPDSLSDADLQHARALMDQAITDADWLAMWQAIAKITKTSTDPVAVEEAQRLLHDYRHVIPIEKLYD